MKRLRRAGPLLALVAAILPPRAGASPGRDRVELDGSWEIAETADPAVALPRTSWKPFTVPGLVASTAEGGTRYAWFRRDLPVPAGWGGRRVFLRLAGARWDARVLLDGVEVAARLEGFTPWEVEVTRLVQPGTTHRLAVRCRDWSATFADGFVLPTHVSGDLRYATGGRTLAPVGGHHTWFGLWDGVALESRPPAYLDNVAIVPSVRAARLTVSGFVDGPAPGAGIEAEVRDGSRTVLVLPGTTTGSQGRWAVTAPWTDPPLWSPEDPHRLTLRLTLRGPDGGILDRREEVFGFRELWADGPDFVLNGVRRHLLATSTWPPTQTQTREDIRRVIARVKEAHCIAMRLHTQPWREAWLEEADAAGLMIVDEAALWCDGGGGYAYKDPRFWENYRNHVAAMIRRDRNHPALIMWSLENELLHCGGGAGDPGLERKLGDLGRFARALDPSHLITYEADLDPDGAADVVGLHYPHELPDYADWPDTADWLDTTVATGTGGGLMGSRGAAFRWDRRKPLYIGEFLWVPDGSASPGTVYFGDEALADVALANRRAKAACWEDQVLAYRRAGVSGQCPWTMFEGSPSRFPLDLDPEHNPFYQAQQRAYVPVAVFPRERDTRFFRGDAVTRTLDVFNDSVARARLRLGWNLGPGGPAGSTTLVLEPGGRAVVPLALTAAVAPGTSVAIFSAVLTVDGFRVHEAHQAWTLFARRVLRPPPGWRVLVPAAGLPPALTGLGWPALPADPARWDPATDLVILAGAAPADRGEPPGPGGPPLIGSPSRAAGPVTAFLAHGGRVLGLGDAGGALGLTLLPRPITMAFPMGPADPLLAGMEPEMFRFWHPGHRVADGAYARPDHGGARAPVVAGGPDGLDTAPVLDLACGPGRAILLPAAVAEKLGTEPAAFALFQNALDVLAAHRPPAGGTLVVADDPAFLARVARLGVVADGWPAGPPAVALDRTILVVAHGGGPAIRAAGAALSAWLTPGRTFYWHAPAAEDFALLARGLGLEGLAVVPAQGPVTIADRGAPELSGISREDLRFLAPSTGGGWERVDAPDPAVIDRALFPAGSRGPVSLLRARDLTPDGEYVSRLPDGSAIGLFTNGGVTGTCRLPAAGLQTVTVRASGTALGGIFPDLVIRANGAEVGRVSLSRSGPADYPALVPLPAGSVSLAVAFINDAAGGGEDRNCLIHRVTVTRDAWAARGLGLLTLPPALVTATAPGGGRVVLDTVRWDRPGPNRVRAGRYASGLLRNLGASFTPPEPDPDWVPAAAFRQVGTFPNFSTGPSGLQFGSEGTADAGFACATAGRYAVFVRGSSSPAAGGYGRARITVDGRPAGEVEVAAESSEVFGTGVVLDLAAGRHSVTAAFTNDLYRPPEDRNLTINAVGFRRLP